MLHERTKQVFGFCKENDVFGALRMLDDVYPQMQSQLTEI